MCWRSPLSPLSSAAMPDHRINLHLVSDATGETLNAIARATTVQFEHADIVYHRWSLIRTRFQLHRVLEGVEHEPGPVLSTLVDRALRGELETTCRRLNVPVVNVLDPVMNLLQDYIGEEAAARPGRQYALNADYFRRIDAMHYVLAHDDGQAQPGLAEADVVLVGVSRSSKTPTCFYLANRGIKAANVPLVPNLPEPPGLETVECPVIGLTLDAEALIEIRRHRLRLIAAGNAAAIARQNSTEYIDEDAVKAELLWARRLCNRRGWPVIDVTRRSIEETAATVLQLMEAWHERRRKEPRPRRPDAAASDAAADPGQCLRVAPRPAGGGRPDLRGPAGGHRRGGGQARRSGRRACEPRRRHCCWPTSRRGGCAGRSRTRW